MTRMKPRSAVLLVSTMMFSGISAFAQVDLSGYWAVRIQEDQTWRGPGSDLGEYQGIPLNAAGRQKAATWNASLITMPERQCDPLPADDFTDIGAVRIWAEVDPASQQVIAWHEYTEWQAQERIIWMDGRPHPSVYAPHTWQGFSTGKWEGNQLTIETTHLKMAQYERTGEYRSDLGTLREHWIRHGDHITFMVFISDPVYLAEPFVRTRDYVLNPNQQLRGYACTPTVEIATRPAGYVPHYLPGKNPYLLSATRFGVPVAAIGGGPETIYPDFRYKLQDPSFASNPLPAHQTPVPTPEINGTIPANLDSVSLTVLPVQGNVYLIAGAGGNITLQVGESSALLVDTSLAPLSPKILAAVKQVTDKPIRYIINTSFDADHTGGNAEISKAGNQIGGREPVVGGDKPAGAAIIAQEQVLLRMSAPTGTKSPVPVALWPTETYATEDYQLFNGEGILVTHEPAAHTDGDSIVFFRRSDVLSVGDLFSTVSYPAIDRKNGGSIEGTLAALNYIIRVSIPRRQEEGGTYIVPGHGRICDRAEVVEYRDMVTIIRDRIADLIREGKTLEQILGSSVTLDYDGRYGATTPQSSRAQFIEAIYADLTQKNEAKSSNSK